MNDVSKMLVGRLNEIGMEKLPAAVVSSLVQEVEADLEKLVAQRIQKVGQKDVIRCFKFTFAKKA